jgi:hypothetical protein
MLLLMLLFLRPSLVCCPCCPNSKPMTKLLSCPIICALRTFYPFSFRTRDVKNEKTSELTATVFLDFLSGAGVAAATAVKRKQAAAMILLRSSSAVAAPATTQVFLLLLSSLQAWAIGELAIMYLRMSLHCQEKKMFVTASVTMNSVLTRPYDDLIPLLLLCSRAFRSHQ